MSLVVGNTEVIDSDRNLKNVAYIIEDGDVEDGAVLVRDSTKDSKVRWSANTTSGSSPSSSDINKKSLIMALIL